MADQGRVDVQLNPEGGVEITLHTGEVQHTAILAAREAREIGVGLISAAAVGEVLVTRGNGAAAGSGGGEDAAERPRPPLVIVGGEDL